jgi:hypothetical protein
MSVMVRNLLFAGAVVMQPLAGIFLAGRRSCGGKAVVHELASSARGFTDALSR